MSKLKGKLISCLLLLSFLIPTIGESIHQISHSDDLHCNEKSEHHIHQLEHHCLICDFAFTTYYSDIQKPELAALNFFIVPYNLLSLHSFHFEQETFQVLRGPPLS